MQVLFVLTVLIYVVITIGCNAVNELSDFWTLTCLALPLHKAAGMWQHLSEKALVWEEKWEVCEPDMLIEQGHTPNALILLSLSQTHKHPQALQQAFSYTQWHSEGNAPNPTPSPSHSLLFSDIINSSAFNYRPRRAVQNFTMLTNLYGFICPGRFTFTLKFLWSLWSWHW